MANRPPYPGTDDDSGVRPTADRPPSTPRWVKVFGIIVIVVVLLVIAMMFIGGGEHGPNRHSLGGDTPSASLAEGQVPPEGGYG